MKLKIAIVAAVAALAAVAMTTAASAKPEKRGDGEEGPGRRNYPASMNSSFNFTDGFDPTGSTSATRSASTRTCSCARSSGTTTSRVLRATCLVPDLATNLGKVSNGGKTYTFKIKQGVKFGPPLNRQITSADFKFAMERIKYPKLAAGYGFYYNEVKSVGTPDASTVVYNLTKPLGDFRFRIGMPAAGRCPRKSQAASPRPQSTAASSSRRAPT